MKSHITYSRKIAIAFGGMVALCLLICTLSVMTLRTVVTDKDRLVSDNAANMLEVRQLETLVMQHIASNRAYYLSKNESFLSLARQDEAQTVLSLARLSARLTSAEDRRLLGQVETLARQWRDVSAEVIGLRRTGGDLEAAGRAFEVKVAPRAKAMQLALDGLVEAQSTQLERARQVSNEKTSSAIWLLGTLGGIALLAAIAAATVLSRGLTRQIGDTIIHLQASSVELQAAANQQVMGSGEQAGVMNEVATTMRELLATSRQIAESAQRVAHMADETAEAARTGGLAVVRGQAAISTIRVRVDQIVANMGELGRKSQQIGGVLDITKELAEQTNILAINATIEAAGAGEHGRRFAAVADEIRKLADRVTDSTGEIRGLIEDIRTSTNTTVMATEDGSKAVDVGASQIGDLVLSFNRITGLVGNTAEAAREIELSTKQQTTAVEQVNLAIGDAAQAAKESEASSRQTLLTSAQLAVVSRELAVLIHTVPQAPRS